jgi:hypothetical protein
LPQLKNRILSAQPIYVNLIRQKSHKRLLSVAICRKIHPSRNKSSKFKGVHWHEKCGKWAAQITCDHKTYHLGYFGDEIDAAKAYDKAALKHHGQFAQTNFPDI